MRRKLGFVLLAVLGVAALLGIIGFWIVFGPNTRIYSGERSLKIPPGTGFAAVVDSLRSSGILQSKDTYGLVAKLTGWGGQIKAGHYVFESGASNYDMLNKLRKGLQEPIHLTIPPGTRPEVVAAVAGKEMYFTREDFMSSLAELADEMGTDTQHLFGYMLPETYFVYWLTEAKPTVAKVVQQFDAFYERELKSRADSLGLSKDDLVTLASIIEWETSNEQEKATVAGVYVNRLRIGMKLDADPTIQYVVMAREGQKRRLLYEDYRIEDPFNTYLRAGLPPAPITNPSPSSLRAAASPEKHQYLYFVATGDGTHKFSRTLAEHNRAAREYHDLMRQRRAGGE